MPFSAICLPRSLIVGLALLILVSLTHVLYSDLGISVCGAPRSASLKEDEPEFLGRFLKQFHSSDDESEDGETQDSSLLDEARLTKNGGFLRLQQPGGPVGFYGVSMYHQLHCLEMLRDGITGAVTGHGNHSHHGAGSHDEQAEESFHHLLHCVDYLAQVCFPFIMHVTCRALIWFTIKAAVCAADDTIEPARVVQMDNGYRLAVIDGAHAAHHCRDAQAISHVVKSSQDKPITVARLAPGDTVTVLGRRAARPDE